MKVICDGAKECGMAWWNICKHASEHCKSLDCVKDIFGKKKKEGIFCFRADKVTNCVSVETYNASNSSGDAL